MATINRGYPELPANVNPDVPHYVNLALRIIDADIEDLEKQSEAGNARAADAAGQAVSIAQSVKARADAGEFRGRQGERGEQGRPGLPGNAVPTDEAIAAAWSMPGSQSRRELDAHYVTAVNTEHGTALYLNGEEI